MRRLALLFSLLLLSCSAATAQQFNVPIAKEAKELNEMRQVNEIRKNPAASFVLASDTSASYKIEVLGGIMGWFPIGGVSTGTRTKSLSDAMPSDAWVRVTFTKDNGEKYFSDHFYVPKDAAGKTVVLVYRDGISEWHIGKERESLIRYFPKEAISCDYVTEEDKYPCFKSMAKQNSDPQMVCTEESKEENPFADISIMFMQSFYNLCLATFSAQMKDSSICNQMNLIEAQDYCHYSIHQNYDIRYRSIWFIANVLPFLIYIIILLAIIFKIRSPLWKYPSVGLLIAEVPIGYIRQYLLVPLSATISEVG